MIREGSPKRQFWHWHFVIFAVLDVSLAVNLCINCSFLHLFHTNDDPILYCFPQQPDIAQKMQHLYTPSVFNAPVGGDNIKISQRCLVLEKPEWCSYHMLKKIWWHVKPLWYDTGTWQTDGQNSYTVLILSISIAALTHAKNDYTH